MNKFVFLLFIALLPSGILSASSCKFKTLSGEKPLVIGHRGAAGYRPEHTIASYQMAMYIGADFIEPDLVSTKDGTLIARHEPNIIDTTNVKSHPEFANRRRTKIVDGAPMSGFFTEDFTLAEIKTLRAVQSHAYRDFTYNDQFPIPTFDEIIMAVEAYEKKSGRKVGIYPETKHPTYFRSLGLPLEDKLIDTLVAHKFTDPKRVFIQSFEVDSLKRVVAGAMKRKGIKLPLIQLYDEFRLQPYDFVLSKDPRTFGDLAQKNILKNFVATYAAGIGVWKDSFIEKEAINPKADLNGDGIADAPEKLTGKVLPLIADAHAAHLLVHPYTMRNEERYLALGYHTVLDELHQLIELGSDGIFSDFPDSVRFAVDTYCKP
ncbi:MAG: glycerophosphodiester phosphodiesterase [Chitinophagaceae bacterium]|nr:glycerophosphodiester phosphodiesterase [Oligoflexus sp.]